MTEKEHSAHTTYRFSVITPVHVGSGVKLGKIDIVPQGSKLIVVDMESVFSRFENNPSVLNHFGGNDFKIKDFLDQHKIKANTVKKYAIENPDNISLGFKSEVLEMIKTGMGNPLIPGSSIKGAIRTVIWWHLVQSEKNQAVLKEELTKVIKSKNRDLKEQRADDELDKNLFGENPNHDFMRGLQVGDVEFRLSDIKLLDCKVLNLTSENGYGWEKMGRNGFITPDPKKATPLYCESLNPKATAAGKMKIEDFLFDDDLAKPLNFSGKKELLDNLPEKCNEFAKTFIADEIAFFKSCNMQEMVNFYTDLEKKIPADNSSFLLHLGWGSGWRGMTGNYLEDYLEKDDFAKLRIRFNLGKSHSDIFPKTRKIAFQNGKPAYPLGWIKISAGNASADNKSVPNEKPQTVSLSAQSSADKEKVSVEKPALKQTASPAPAARLQEPRQTELMQKFQDFRLNPSPESFAEFAEFAEQITAEESEELKNISLKNLGIHIGYAAPLLSSSRIPDDIKKILAAKLLEVIQKSDKWNAKKLEAYNKLQLIS